LGEQRPYLGFIVFFEHGAVNDVEDVITKVAPVVHGGLYRQSFQLWHQAIAHEDEVACFQRLPQVSVLAFLNCPGLGRRQLLRGIGVGHIKHVAQPGRGLAIIQQGNAFGTSLDIAVILLIPFVIGSAGSGIRALGMDG